MLKNQFEKKMLFYSNFTDFQTRPHNLDIISENNVQQTHLKVSESQIIILELIFSKNLLPVLKTLSSCKAAFERVN